MDNKKSNIALQKAFVKYGLDLFKFCIYEYFTYESKIISQKALTDLETSYILRFNFDSLIILKLQPQVLWVIYIQKRQDQRWGITIKIKIIILCLGETHTEEALALISKPGKLNPMFGLKHSEATKAVMSDKKNKYPLGVGLYSRPLAYLNLLILLFINPYGK